jgi:hypothetical protein
MRDPVQIPVKSLKQRIGETHTDDAGGVMFFARHGFLFPVMALPLFTQLYYRIGLFV